MPFRSQKILPAARSLQQFDQLLKSPFEHIVLLEVHIGNLKMLKTEAEKYGKKVIIHADFLCNDIRPAGIISTRYNMIIKAKAKGILAIQRIFQLDTIALEKSYSLIDKTAPDYIEMLPGVIPELIYEVYERTGIPIITGGLIRTRKHVQDALNVGAVAVTTSDHELWESFT